MHFRCCSQVLAGGGDFVANPTLSPDGRTLAWFRWSHPNMPWDGTELCVAAVDDSGALGETRVVCGGPSESVLEPLFGPDGALYFISDRSGWWGLYKQPPGTSDVTPVFCREVELGGPMWQFGRSLYRLLPDGTVLCTVFDPKVPALPLPYCTVNGGHVRPKLLVLTRPA